MSEEFDVITSYTDWMSSFPELEPIEVGSCSNSRVALLDHMLRIIPNGVATLWLAEYVDQKVVLIPAYVCKSQTLVGIELDWLKQQSPTALDFNFDADWEVSVAQLQETEIDMGVGAALASQDAKFEDCRTNNHWLIGPKFGQRRDGSLFKAVKGVIGLLSVSYPRILKKNQPVSLSKGQLNAISHTCSMLSATIWQSRQERILSTTNSLLDVLHIDENPQKIRGDICQLLRVQCKARACLWYMVEGETANLMAQAGLEGVAARFVDQISGGILEQIKLEGTWIRGSMDVDLGEGLSELAAKLSIESWLAVPISMPARNIEDLAAGVDFSDSSPPQFDRVVTNILVLFGKEDSLYAGEGFSPVDRRIATLVAEQVAHFIPGQEAARLNENVGSKPNEYELGRSSFVANAHSRLTDYLRNVESSFLVTARYQGDDGHVEIDIDSSLAGDPSKEINNGLLSIANSIQKDIDEGDSQSNNFSEKSLVLNSQEVLWAFNLGSPKNPNRFLAFLFKSRHIPQHQEALLRRIVARTQLALEAIDASREQKNTIAQIRHAVVGPLAECKNWLMSVRLNLRPGSFAQERMSSEAAKAELRNKVQKAFYLSEQAWLLAESGKFLFDDLDKSEIAINRKKLIDIIRDALLPFDHEKKRRKLTLRISSGNVDPNFVVNVDAQLMTLAIANLYDNAVKYSREGHEVEIKLGQTQSHWELSISNWGNHVAVQDRDRIFSEFYRAPARNARYRRPGTGLGLPVVRRIIKAHSEQAEVFCVSMKEKTVANLAYVTFTISMPRSLDSSKEK